MSQDYRRRRAHWGTHGPECHATIINTLFELYHLLRVLFPPLNGLFGNTSYGAEWEATWRAEQQVTAPGYFRRYFQYAVPARDT